MSVEELKFCTAGMEDVDDILRILAIRMKWLEQRGLKQWDGYFDCYPRSYFEAGAARGDFYLLKEGTAIVAVLALFERDGRGIFMLIIWQRFRDTPASGRICFAVPKHWAAGAANWGSAAIPM